MEKLVVNFDFSKRRLWKKGVSLNCLYLLHKLIYTVEILHT